VPASKVEDITETGRLTFEKDADGKVITTETPDPDSAAVVAPATRATSSTG
jgi:hypothetical protein